VGGSVRRTRPAEESEKMKYQLSLRRDAVNDLAEAEAFYEAEQAGLSSQFRDQIAMILRLIEKNPRLFPTSEKVGYLKAVVAIFPFCIYYSVEGEKVVIIAVQHTSRDPKRWQDRTR
jgi:plasmid stabilization system protein ParE